MNAVNFVIFFYAFFLLCVGLAMLLQASTLLPAVRDTLVSPSKRLIAMLAMLPIGLAGVWFHNDFTPNLGLIVTLVAWITCFRVALLLLLPAFVDTMINWILGKINLLLWLRVGGGSLVLLGALLLWHLYGLSRAMPISGL